MTRGAGAIHGDFSRGASIHTIVANEAGNREVRTRNRDQRVAGELVVSGPGSAVGRLRASWPYAQLRIPALDRVSDTNGEAAWADAIFPALRTRRHQQSDARVERL